MFPQHCYFFTAFVEKTSSILCYLTSLNTLFFSHFQLQFYQFLVSICLSSVVLGFTAAGLAK